MKFLFDDERKTFAPISGRASVPKTLDLGSIPYLVVSNKKGQCEDSTVCGRQADKTWQLNSKTERFLCCLLLKGMGDSMVNTTEFAKIIGH